MILPASFYARPTLLVAEELLGQYLVYESPQGKLVGEINEVESYIGSDDLASHGARGLDQRNRIMFGPAGFAYIYFIYGMYYCLNVVTQEEHFPSAILIRSIIPILGTDIMLSNRSLGKSTKTTSPKQLTNGPGKVCQAYGLTTKHDGMPLTCPPLYIESTDKKITTFQRSSRIGISKAQEHLWRFHY
ncbi:MAG: DNA-3-methyladenine glycosylase [Candidatus Abawacabacteria bacterium]|nr:DNA-3-methyladenine glycosylase [Candidatus Abawacabacteria bacterium]